jgi:fructosamine-3-kinase
MPLAGPRPPLAPPQKDWSSTKNKQKQKPTHILDAFAAQLANNNPRTSKQGHLIRSLKIKKNSNPHGLDFSIDLAGKPVEAQLRHQWSMFLPSTRHGAD